MLCLEQCLQPYIVQTMLGCVHAALDDFEVQSSRGGDLGRLDPLSKDKVADVLFKSHFFNFGLDATVFSHELPEHSNEVWLHDDCHVL